MGFQRDIKNCKCPKCGHNINEKDLTKDRTIRGRSELGFEIIDYVYTCPECDETLIICPECMGWTYLDVEDDCPTCQGMGMISASRVDGDFNK